LLLWYATVTRNLLAGRLVVHAQVNNLLDRNAGISRTSSANVNTKSSTNPGKILDAGDGVAVSTALKNG
jgi:hypothetical protein